MIMKFNLAKVKSDKSFVLSFALLVKRPLPYERNYLHELLGKLNLASDFIIRGNANESSLQVAA